MYMRKHDHNPRHRGPKQPQFAPEAFGDFDVVSDQEVAEVRAEMAEKYGFGEGKWEVVEDVAR